MQFDGGVKVVSGNTDVVTLLIDDEVDTQIVGSDVKVSGSKIEFDYHVPATAAGKLLSVSMKSENKIQVKLNKNTLEDDMNRRLSEYSVTRPITSSCGPAYLLDNTKMDVCRCRRTSTRCECNCGGLGASLEYQ